MEYLLCFYSFYIYNSVSISYVQPHFFIIGCTVNHHHQLFNVQRYGSPGRHQTPVDALPYRRRFFAADFRNQRLGILQKISADCLAYCLIGLPSSEARKKA